ncbi:MAG: outer membrane lipoprotein-sorting protein [Candidatus Binatia bacterium]
MSWTVIIVFLVALASTPARADMQNLKQFLHDVEEATHTTTPLRGDGQFEVVSTDATRHDQVAVILRPPADTYIELKQEGKRVLLLNTAGKAYQFTKGATAPAAFPATATFAGSDFTREDLEPFRLARFQDARISDETVSQLTVTLFPRDSQYSLVVATFDREKKVPVKMLYYRDTLNNLVKMRRDTHHVLVGRKWMATTSTMETFKLRTHTTFTLHWTQKATFPPELFDPVFLPRPSMIRWPTATAPRS